ncbi:MAG: YggS family pyridoxal phosphate-dependent enzyme [Propioniciclava sp.]|uniref:YggS family pyridoxal phosphate-dependent enzyme n=1 Tax=Propioniciclava sp. TaxID=2038686 RepID=UPI0039E52486
MDVAANLAAARARIDAACARAGREPGEVELLPVSKTHGADLIRAAHAAGYRRFGESKPQELAAKASELAGLGLEWVVIGHLQTNKARVVAEVADEFQALDSLHLAEALNRRSAVAGRRLAVLVQVNSSGEATKDGFAPAEVPDAVRALARLDALQVRGLMTLAANTPDREVVRRCFVTMTDLQARLRDEHGGGFDALSMGMSGDFELAVECGSTCVRLGTGIFGARVYA